MTWARISRRGSDWPEGNATGSRFIPTSAIVRPVRPPFPPQLPFPTMSFGTAGRYKLFGLVTNRTLPGDEVIRWQRERCGKSEEAHAVMKDDLAGGRLPSGLFGANVAWWAIMVLAHNLNALMKHRVLGGD